MFKWSLLDRKGEWHKDNPDECTFHQIFSAIRSANGLKLKEKLIADSFVREAQINKHHTDRASLLYILKPRQLRLPVE